MTNRERDIVADEFEKKCCEGVARHTRAGVYSLIAASAFSLTTLFLSPLVPRVNPYRDMPDVRSYVKLKNEIESLESERRGMFERGIRNNVSLEEGIKHERERMKGASSCEDVKKYNEWNNYAKAICLAAGGAAIFGTMIAPFMGAVAVPGGYRFYRTVRRKVRNFI